MTLLVTNVIFFPFLKLITFSKRISDLLCDVEIRLAKYANVSGHQQGPALYLRGWAHSRGIVTRSHHVAASSSLETMNFALEWGSGCCHGSLGPCVCRAAGFAE